MMNKYWEDKIKGPTVVKFGADWCTSCREAEVILNELEEIYNKQIGFVRIDVDSCPQEILDECNVNELPALFVWRDAELKPATLDQVKKYCKDSWKVRGVDYYTREDVEKLVKETGKTMEDFDKFMYGQAGPVYPWETPEFCYFTGDVERFLYNNNRSEERFIR